MCAWIDDMLTVTQVVDIFRRLLDMSAFKVSMHYNTLYKCTFYQFTY